MSGGLQAPGKPRLNEWSSGPGFPAEYSADARQRTNRKRLDDHADILGGACSAAAALADLAVRRFANLPPAFWTPIMHEISTTGRN